MKTILIALAAATALAGAVAAPASAQPYGPPGYHHDHGWRHGPRYGWRPRPHRVCVIRHHREWCRWVR